MQGSYYFACIKTMFRSNVTGVNLSPYFKNIISFINMLKLSAYVVVIIKPTGKMDLQLTSTNTNNIEE